MKGEEQLNIPSIEKIKPKNIKEKKARQLTQAHRKSTQTKDLEAQLE